MYGAIRIKNYNIKAQFKSTCSSENGKEMLVVSRGKRIRYATVGLILQEGRRQIRGGIVLS